MKGLKQRLIVIPKGTFKTSNFRDFINYVKDISKSMDSIDNDAKIKDICEKVSLKENKIKQFKGLDVNEFHQEVMGVIEEANANFLIFKN
jgi:hypothetical protein